MDIRALLKLEQALNDRLRASWRRESLPVYEQIAKDLTDKKFGQALQHVHKLDMTHVGQENRPWIKHMLLSCAIFGSKIANKRGPQFMTAGTYDKTLDHVTDVMCQFFEHRATALVQTRMLQSIARAEQSAHPLAAVTKGEAQKDDSDAVGASPADASPDLSVSVLNQGGKLNPEQAEAPPRRRKRRKLRRKGEPATLYVSRRLTKDCAKRFIAWAKSQGFESCTPAEDMHATICYSRDPIDWDGVDPQDSTDGLKVSAGKRTVEQLGDKGGVVLYFESPDLTKRWQQFRDSGASWDYEDYHPHVTISYNAKGLNTTKVGPFSEPLEFGPEQWEPLDTDWSDKLVEKADDSGRFVTPFVSFADDGDQQIQLASSLNSSRLATWGFTSECEQLGRQTYRLTAVLDGRTSPFCRIIDGREFSVASASKQVLDSLMVQNPEDLKEVQPWPDQSKDAIAEYEQMSDDELIALGLNIPPFHPFCRTMCVSSDENEGETGPGLEGGENTGPLETVAATPQDFQDVGISDVTEDELAHWNDYIGLNPQTALETMFGGDLEALKAKLVDKALDILSGGSFGFRATGILEDGTFDLETVLDPFTRTVYLEGADLTGDPEQAAQFMRRVFNGMIDTGMSAGMSALAVDVGDGAYDYLQMGFLPKADDWEDFRQQSIDALQDGSLKDVFDSLNADDKDELLNILSNPDEHALNDLLAKDWQYDGQAVGEILLQDLHGQFVLDLTDDDAVAQAKEYFGDASPEN